MKTSISKTEMSVIDEIEAELKNISPWPWKWDLRPKMEILVAADKWRSYILLCGNRGGLRVRDFKRDLMVDIHEDHPDVKFIAASPERIAKLVAYVRATETLLKTWKPLQLAAMSEDLQHARVALGLEDTK